VGVTLTTERFFEFIRNEKLRCEKPCPGRLKTPLRFNDFGWDFGGPIKRGKLFFFAGEEWKRIRLTATPQSRTLPTPAELTGDFSALLHCRLGELHEPGKPGTLFPATGSISIEHPAYSRRHSDCQDLQHDGGSGERALPGYSQGCHDSDCPQCDFPAQQPFNWRQDLFVRLDYRFNDKHSLYARILHDNF